MAVYPDLQLELMNFRVTASARRNVADVAEIAPVGDSDGKIGTRRAFCPRLRQWADFAVHRRASISIDRPFPGPAIVEENESTTVIPSGARAWIDPHGSLIVKLANQEGHDRG